MATVAQDYRKWRALHPDMPARYALSYARSEHQMRDTLARFGEWEWTNTGYGVFAYADMPADSYTIRVMVGDDDQPVEWGDTDPTDEERANASAYYVAVQVLDAAGDEMYCDGIGGVDVIDLPGYLQRDWEDAAAYALIEYLLDEAERFARNEASERAEWAARDTITVAR